MALFAGAVVVAGFAGAFSLAQVIANNDLVRAHNLAPYDGLIAARLAASMAGAEATEDDRKAADALARRALQRDPTAVAAVSTLGINAQVRGDTASAQRLFLASQLLSRRDLQTQIWAIEDAVARNDIPAALRHYDIALRTTPAASDLLFPVLAAASEDPAIRTALIATLAGGTPWSGNFMHYASGGNPEPRAAAQLFLGLRRAGVAVPESASAGVVHLLIVEGAYEPAWSYYAAIRKGADRGRSRDAGFTASLQAPSRFDWMSINNGTIVTEIGNGAFDFSATGGSGGALLEQMQLLTPGDYRLRGRSGGIDQIGAARPYWILVCQDGRELGRVEVPNSVEASTEFNGVFHVPSDCPIQALRLVARPSAAIGGLSGRIETAELMAVGR